MQEEREQELKLLINAAGYKTLLQTFQQKRYEEQRNHYFDCPLLLFSKKKITIRVRTIDDQYQLCVKVKKSETDSLISKSFEYKEMICEQDFLNIIEKPDSLLQMIDTEISDFLKKINPENSPLKYLGSLANRRDYLEGIDGYIFEVDQSLFPNGKVEYELEIERMIPEHVQHVINIIENLGVNCTPNQISKYNRFLMNF